MLERPIANMIASSLLLSMPICLSLSLEWLCVSVLQGMACHDMAWPLPSIWQKRVASSSQPRYHQRASCIWVLTRAASLDVMGWVRWEESSLTMVGKSALSYLASSISMTLLVSFRVLTGSWARQVLCLNALVTLGLSCRLTIFLVGRRTLSIVIKLCLCRAGLPMIR